MPSFSVDRYNALLELNEAHVELSRQLCQANSSLHDLIKDPEITKLFMDGESAFQFGICILHRHYRLKPGERMVSVLLDPKTPDVMITEPSDDPSDEIRANSWLPDGSDFEHAIPTPLHPPISPPSADFLAEFRRICGRYKVNILGLCLAELPVGVIPGSGLVVLEQPHGRPEERRQRTTVVRKEDLEGTDVRQAAWVPVRLPPVIPFSSSDPAVNNAGTNETQRLSTLSCLHNCTNHFVPLQGPTLAEKIEYTAEINISKSVPPPPLRGHNANHI